jgi:hypothetical protein
MIDFLMPLGLKSAPVVIGMGRTDQCRGVALSVFASVCLSLTSTP